MSNNNIDNLIFQNHDTYVYETKPFVNDSVHLIVLPPVNQDPDTVTYESYLTLLTTNGVNTGTFKVNRFTREQPLDKLSTVTFLGTITTAKGTLVFNYAGNILTNNNLYVLTQNFVSYATYKGGDYGQYLNVKISIDASHNDYRVVTISY